MASNDNEAPSAGGANVPPEPELRGPLKPVAETTPLERLAAGVAVLAVGTALAAIIIEQSIIVIIAGVLSIIVGPYSYYQQTQLTDIKTLQETTAAVEQEVNRLEAENERLGKSIDELGDTIDKLQDVEEALDVISKTKGQSLDALEKQVEENREILKKMEKSTKGRIIQNLISVIYRGDTDMDDCISADEVGGIIEGVEKISGVQVNEDKLRATITGKSTDSVIEVVKNLLNDDTPKEDRIFILSED